MGLHLFGYFTMILCNFNRALYLDLQLEVYPNFIFGKILLIDMSNFFS